MLGWAPADAGRQPICAAVLLQPSKLMLGRHLASQWPKPGCKGAGNLLLQYNY